jgi:sugar (pentulose or hexulose) kinase
METAGEGGAWGIALLSAFQVRNVKKLSLEDYLDQVVFAGNKGVSVEPIAEDVAGFEKYTENYKRCLPVEQSAVDHKI